MRAVTENGEYDRHFQFLLAAAEASKASQCRKSQRGVVIVNHKRRILGSGANNPPLDRICSAANCYDPGVLNICNQYAIHAEVNALKNALNSVRNATMYHIKTVDGDPVPSGGPSCLPCAGSVLDAGIAEFVLLHETQKGELYIAIYPIQEFFDLSVKSAQERFQGLRTRGSS